LLSSKLQECIFLIFHIIAANSSSFNAVPLTHHAFVTQKLLLQSVAAMDNPTIQPAMPAAALNQSLTEGKIIQTAHACQVNFRENFHTI
jgi:hypothetical protein